MAKLLCEAASAEAPGVECRTVLDEAGAIRTALDELGEGDVVIAFCDEYDAAIELLKAYGAEPASGFAVAAAGQVVTAAYK